MRRAPKRLFVHDYRPDFRLAEARRVNAEVAAQVAKGRDPLAERRAKHTTQLAETDAMNVAGLIASYIADRSDQWRPNTVKAFNRDLDRIKRELERAGWVRIERYTRHGAAVVWPIVIAG